MTTTMTMKKNQIKIDFKEICKYTQAELKKFVITNLSEIYGKHNICAAPSPAGFVFARGTFPVLLVAHLDTVHKEPVKCIIQSKDHNIISSPQGIGGDDRCGVYMIFKIIEKYHCSVLFCEDEEVGGLGARAFVQSTNNIIPLTFNYIMEFDRMNANDAVFYDCYNEEFEKFITKSYYKTAFGTFSDISEIAPEFGVAAVNLSCGYYNAHTTKEYVVMSEMEESIEAAIDILDRTNSETDIYEYVESNYRYNDLDYVHGYDYLDKENKADEIDCYLIEYLDGKFDEKYAYSIEAAVGFFLMTHPDLRYSDIVSIDKEEI